MVAVKHQQLTFSFLSFCAVIDYLVNGNALPRYNHFIVPNDRLISPQVSGLGIIEACRRW